MKTKAKQKVVPLFVEIPVGLRKAIEAKAAENRRTLAAETRIALESHTGYVQNTIPK